jgi:serine/threonine-protein kinase RsbW
MDASASRLTLPASTESIAVFRDFVHSGAVAAGLPEGELEKLGLVLEEILINIARYAYAPDSGSVEVAYTHADSAHVQIEITDAGRVFNPLEADSPDLSRGLADRPIGGLGVFLVRRLVESIEYRREDNRNILSFTFPKDD